MANGRNRRSRVDCSRDAGGFIAVPHAVLDSDSYKRLSHGAKALLMEFARQYVRDNNGRLLATRAYLSTRGWKSARVIHQCKHELMENGFIHETFKGHRPNRASWYAITWYALDDHVSYDPGASALFKRGAYRTNTPLSPSAGTDKDGIAPNVGTRACRLDPALGAMNRVKVSPSGPT